jgi:hypothetical protein
MSQVSTIYNFVSVWTVDDLPRPPARTPVVSSDLLASSGCVVGNIGRSTTPPRQTTTNVLSQDAFVNAQIPLSYLSTTGVSVSSINYSGSLQANGAYVAPGGVFFSTAVSSVVSTIVAPTLVSLIE